MSRFTSLARLRKACLDLPEADPARRSVVAARENQLIKPAGSLGRLEELTVWFAGWRPLVLQNPCILVFAGNHGVLAQNVSLWPQDVTAAMVQNFSKGGAAINQLARIAEASLHVIPLSDLKPSADLTVASALSEAAFLEAVETGYDSVPETCDLLALGEMGVGNTTAAAALTAALFGGTGTDWAGRGAGLDNNGVRNKAETIDRALAFHGRTHDPLELARLYGGHELAALLGATLSARHKRIPVLLDGFVVTAAVSPLHKLHESGLSHTKIAHCSDEQGHRRLCRQLDQEPVFDLGLRLGEGSGAALAIPIIRAALACHTGMACFVDTQITNRNNRTSHS